MTEQNDPTNMTVENCVNDFSGALIGPMQRLKFWGGEGLMHRRVEGFPYVQASLRESLAACEGLGLYVSVPGRENASDAKVSNELLSYAVKSYADLSLNKQQRMIDIDPSWMAMRETLDAQLEYALKPRFAQYVAAEGRLRSAMYHALLNAGNKKADGSDMMSATMGNVLQDYESTVQLYGRMATGAPNRLAPPPAAQKSLSGKLFVPAKNYFN